MVNEHFEHVSTKSSGAILDSRRLARRAKAHGWALQRSQRAFSELLEAISKIGIGLRDKARALRGAEFTGSK
jgi:hypothetical protein